MKDDPGTRTKRLKSGEKALRKAGCEACFFFEVVKLSDGEPACNRAFKTLRCLRARTKVPRAPVFGDYPARWAGSPRK